MSDCHVYQASKIKSHLIEGYFVNLGYRATFFEFVKVKYGEFLAIQKKSKE